MPIWPSSLLVQSDGLLEMIAIEQKSVHKSTGPAAVLLSAGQKHDKVNHILNWLEIYYINWIL